MAYYNNPYMATQYVNPVMANQQQRLAQMEQQLYPQYGQPQQTQGLSGRIVDDENTINVSEIPMDGNIAIFPLRNSSKIVVKSWQPNGTILTRTYLPQIQTQDDKASNLSSESQNDEIMANLLTREAFEERVSTLESKIDTIFKNLTPKSASSRAKKESEEQ